MSNQNAASSAQLAIEASSQPDEFNIDCQLDLLEQAAVEKGRPKSKIRKLYERGMATAEYAVGILAAAALALVLLKIFTGNDFFDRMVVFVVNLLDKVAEMAFG